MHQVFAITGRISITPRSRWAGHNPFYKDNRVALRDSLAACSRTDDIKAVCVRLLPPLSEHDMRLCLNQSLRHDVRDAEGKCMMRCAGLIIQFGSM